VYTPRGEIRVAERVVVGAHAQQLRVAIDGERLLVETPLELSIEPRALRVLVPRSPVP
jgi:diacylglycerol kinase family enzyme